MPSWEERPPTAGSSSRTTCRQTLATRWHADPGTYRIRYPDRVASGTVADSAEKTTLQIDVAVFGPGDEHRDTLLALGEAKWQEVITTGHLKKLEHVRDLLLTRGEPGAETARLLLFSGAGFSDAIMK